MGYRACVQAAPGRLAPTPTPRRPHPLRRSSRAVQLGPLSAHSRRSPCPARLTEACPHPPEACPEGGHAPSQDSEEAGPRAGLGPFCAVLSPPGCPLSSRRGRGSLPLSALAVKPASGAQFALLALPWSLQPPCWASPWWPCSLVTGPQLRSPGATSPKAGIQRAS